MRDSYVIERDLAPPPMVRVELHRAVGDAERGELLAGVMAAIVQRPTTVLIDIRRLTGYDPQLRALLLELQRQILSKGGRAVYVADRPRLRGLALWVIHMAEDPTAKIVGNVAAAIEWLRVEDLRMDDAERRTLGALAKLTGEGGGEVRE